MKWSAVVGAVLLATLAGCGEGAPSPAAGKQDTAGTSNVQPPREAAEAGSTRTQGTGLESGSGTSSVTASPDGGGTDTGAGSGTGSPDAGAPTASQPAPSLLLDAPAQGAFFGAGGVAVVGRVEGGEPPVQVTVGEQAVPVVGGAFSTSLALGEGEHTLDIRVTDAQGRMASEQRTVQVDVTKPSLVVTRPTGSGEVTESPYLVTGEAGDANLAGVSVQGEPVPLLAGHFSVAVPLVAGANTLRIIATDLAGNREVVERTLTLSSQAPSISILEPLPGREAEQPVVRVRARVTSTAPVAEVRVGTGAATLSGPQEYSAEVPLSLGDNSITVYARDTDGLSASATVQVRYRSAASEPLIVTGVDPLPGTAEVETDSLISVSFNKPVLYESLASRFTVSADGVPLAGGYSLAPGGQTATFVAREPLPEGKRLTVRVGGVQPAQEPGMGGDFTSDFSVRHPLTRVRGLVTDLERLPLSGVKVSIEGQGLSTSTGPDGNWVLFLPKGGEYTVRYEGGVRSTGERLPTVRRRLFVAQGELTTDVSLVLTPIDAASSEAVDVTKPVSLGFAGRHPGLSLQVPADGLSFEDGHTTDFVTATRLEPYALPVPLMGQAAPVGLWQVSPAGIRVQAPVTLTLPNLTGAPAGRLALVLGYDATRHVLERVAFARVSADGTVITTDAPLRLGALDFLGYMPLSEEQHAQVAVALGLTTGGASGAGTDGGSGLDGGLGKRVPAGVTAPRSPWWDLLLFPLATSDAYAITLAELFSSGLSSFDQLNELNVPGSLSGYVRMPREREILFTRTAPADAELSETPRSVPLPYELPIAFEVKFEAANAMDALVGENVEARVRAVSSVSGELPTVADYPQQSVGLGETRLNTRFRLPPGKTRIWLTGSSMTDMRQLELEAELTPDDAGASGTLVLRKVSDTTPQTDPALRTSTRFRGLGVRVTGPAAGGAGVTGNAGNFGVPIRVLPPFEQGVACTEVALGPRLEERTGPDGVTHYTTVLHMLPVCSRSFSVYPGRNTQADIIVDARLLYGGVTFVDRQGEPLDADCAPTNAKSLRGDTPGEYLTIAPEDVTSTEVHFFREDDLEHPIATFDVARPDPRACEEGVYQPGQAHGLYSRIRIGPSSPLKKYALERCRELSRKARNAEEEEFFAANCKDNRTNFLSLSTGDRLVVFAINHATGYSGMTTVTVPPTTRSTQGGSDGGTAAQGCAADDAAGGPLPVNEYDEDGNQLTVSRCTLEELGIPANLNLYPPEIEVRVSRRAEDEGLKSARPASLVRHGGAATTRDDFLTVNTHWRVRVKPLAAVAGGTPDAGADGGFNGGRVEPCRWESLPDGGFRLDGGDCRPGELVDQGDAGTPLEVLCSELPLNATERQKAGCYEREPELVDVPKGVAPLAGRVVGVTGTAVEVPTVVPFPVRPGRHTATVQASLRYQESNGNLKVLSALPRANYYVHIVGHPMLPRDVNQDGYIQPAEENIKPPDFSEPVGGSSGADGGHPPGLPGHAVGLKNVYRHVESATFQRDRYDRALEHEFRVIELGPTGITASSTLQLPDEQPRDLKDEKLPSAQEEDLAYNFLTTLLTPDDPGRAGTLSGEYTVRFGGDAFGVDCPFLVDAEAGTLTASCDSEYLPEVLSANDIVYIELFLSGNAENVLYRFNFFGLAGRTDLLSSGNAYTARQSVKKDLDGVPAAGRPVGQPAMANFFVEPTGFTEGVVRVCLNESCTPAENLLKEAALLLDPATGLYTVTESNGGVARSPLIQDDEPGLRGARRFSLAMPPHVAQMPGSGNPASPIYVVYAAMKPMVEQRVQVLGRPVGAFEGVNADPTGQETVAGINLADGHVSFTHTDFSLPHYAGSIGFSRTYNNQNNQPTPLGIGWSHNQDGWVVEEVPKERYTVVINGQGYAFPRCLAESAGSERVRCETDRAHGGQLVVEAPLPAKPGEKPAQAFIEMTTPEGWRARFHRVAIKGGEAGRRRWLLTQYDQGNGEQLVLKGDDTGEAQQGEHWTHVYYDGTSDRIDRIERTPGLVRLKFVYTDVDMEDPRTPQRIRRLVHAEGFKWLSTVKVEGSGGGAALYSVDFKHDARGNLLRAERSPGVPHQIWSYSYRELDSRLSGRDRWVSVNELDEVKLIHGASAADEGPVQWRALYELAPEKAPKFAHVNVYERMGAVTKTGQQGKPVRIEYLEELKRRITLPDEVMVDVVLNEYGNVIKSSTPLTEASAKWNSDVVGGDVTVSESSAPDGLRLTHQNNAVLAPTTTKIEVTPPGAQPAEINIGAALTELVYGKPEQSGVATSGQYQAGSGNASWSAPRASSPSGPDSITVSDSTVGTNVGLMKGASYDKFGRLMTYTDSQNRTVEILFKNDTAGLGLPETITLRMQAGRPSSGGTGLTTLTRKLTRDSLGRVTRAEDVETGSVEEWTYDGLGRVLTHNRAGNPPESWTYVYTAANDSLTIQETLLAQASSGEDCTGVAAGPGHTRRTVIEDGLKRSETFRAGSPAQDATRSYTYENTRLISSTDEMGTVRSYQYDEDGRLKTVLVGGDVETSYTLDIAGRPTTVTDDLGRKTTIGYDVLGRASRWDYGAQDVEEVKLDAQGAEVTRKFGRNLGHVLNTTVDALGRPRRVVSARNAQAGIETTTEYDEAGRPTLSEDLVLMTRDRYEYNDVLGRMTFHERTINTDGTALKVREERLYATDGVEIRRTIDTGVSTTRTETETRSFDVAGRVYRVERPADEQSVAVDTYCYNARGQVLSHKGPAPHLAVTKYQYDPLGNLTQVTDSEGATTRYTLDAGGRVRTEMGPHPGYKVTYEYDAFDRLKSKLIDAFTLEGVTTPAAQWTYDYSLGLGRVLETDPQGVQTTRTFNARDRLVSETRVGTVAEGSGSYEVILELDGPWEHSRKHKEGTWSVEWHFQDRDDRGRPRTEEEIWNGTGSSYNYTTLTDWQKRHASITSNWSMGGRSYSQTISLDVDSFGNPIQRMSGDAIDRWVYGADGRLSVLQPHGRPETKYVYENGLLKTETYVDEVTRYTYFTDGRLKKREEPTGRFRTFTYTSRGQTLTEKYEGPGGGSQSTRYGYGPDGAVTSVTQGGSQLWKYLRGARGELLGVEQPGALGTFKYTYDALLRLKSIAPPAGGSPGQTFDYDYLGRMAQRTRGSGPGAATWKTKYDGGVAELVTPTLDKTISVLDGRGRPAQVTYVPGSQSAAFKDLSSVTYAYDGQNRFLGVTEQREGASSAITYEYNARGLLAAILRSGEDDVRYGYTPSGQRASVTIGAADSSRKVEYRYDDVKDRLHQLISPRGITEVEWEPGGGNLQKVADSTLFQLRCYDGVGRLKTIINAQGGSSGDCSAPPSSALASFTYSYDARGNRLREVADGTAHPSPGLTEYGYDEADRLTGVRYPGGRAVLYSMAQDGTRLGEKEVPTYTGSLLPDGYDAAVAARHWTYQYDSRGGLDGIWDEKTGSAVADIITDASGRVACDIRAGVATRYGWDAAGRLTNVSTYPQASDCSDDAVPTKRFQYTYDFAGLRRTKTVNAESSRSWLYANGELLEERWLAGSEPARSLLYERVGSIVAAVGSERVLHDGHGSAIGRIAPVATPLMYVFDAWGRYRSENAPNVNDASLGFTGHAWDEGVNLVYAQQRWYDPTLGQFLSEDPLFGELESPVSLSAWLYAWANPARYTDPTGMNPKITLCLRQSGNMPNDAFVECMKSDQHDRAVAAKLNTAALRENTYWRSPVGDQVIYDAAEATGFNDLGRAGTGASEIDQPYTAEQRMVYAAKGVYGAVDTATTIVSLGATAVPKNLAKEGAEHFAERSLLSAADDLAETGIRAADDLAETGIRAADDLAETGIRAADNTGANAVGRMADAPAPKPVSSGGEVRRTYKVGERMPSGRIAGDGPGAASIREPLSAEAAADAAREAGKETGAAAELRIGDQVFTGVSGEVVPHNPQVTAALMGTPVGEQAPWHGACAEIVCLDKALNAGVNPAGGFMRAVNIGVSGAGHNTPKPACSTCSSIMKHFGVDG